MARASGGGQGGGRPRRGRQGDLPMLLGEPSPSLAKINKMNMAKLAEKIVSLEKEQQDLKTRLERLRQLDPPPAEKIAAVTDLLDRLNALHDAAAKRLKEKAARKAIRERG
jgi:chromosome segregation ATPase